MTSFFIQNGKFYGGFEDEDLFEIDFLRFQINKVAIQEEIQYPFFEDFFSLQLGPACLCN